MVEIGALIMAIGLIGLIFHNPKPKEPEKKAIEGNKRILAYISAPANDKRPIVDYRTILFDIQDIQAGILSMQVPIQILGFRNLDKENPIHLPWIDFFSDFIFEKISNAEKIEIDGMKRHYTIPGRFVANIFVDDKNLADMLPNIPELGAKKYQIPERPVMDDDVNDFHPRFNGRRAN